MTTKISIADLTIRDGDNWGHGRNVELWRKGGRNLNYDRLAYATPTSTGLLIVHYPGKGVTYMADAAVSRAHAEALMLDQFAEGRDQAVTAARVACDHLKAARDLLKAAGASKAVDKVRLALSSADGAVRAAGMRQMRDD